MMAFEFLKARLDFSRAFLCLLVAVLLPLKAAGAEEPTEHAWSLSGFGTLGMARTSSDQVEFVRDLSQGRGIKERWDGRLDSLLGLQATYHHSPNLEATVQAVSRYRYDRSSKPDLTWAFINYRPTAETSVRVGRLGTDFFQSSDSRLVGYSYLQARPPGDFFWHLPFYHIDGADASAAWAVGQGIARAKIFSGVSNERLALAEEVWNISGSRMTGGTLAYQLPAWLLRASYATIRFSSDLPIAGMASTFLSPSETRTVLADLRVAGKASDYYSLAAIHEDGPWQLQLMFNRIMQGSRAFEPSSSAYFLVAYRLGAATPYAGFSRVRSSARANTLVGLPGAVAAGFMADSHVDQHTTTIGLRWDVAHNVAVKSQFDQVRGDASSIFPYRRETAAWDGKLDVLSVSLDFIF